MVIVDDHLALLAIAGFLPALGAGGPVVTTYTFQYRMARAVADSALSVSLSHGCQIRRLPYGEPCTRPPHRLVVLDPRASVEEAVQVAIGHRANLLLAELVGAAIHHQAAVRVTPGNQGKTWAELMETEGVDFATVAP